MALMSAKELTAKLGNSGSPGSACLMFEGWFDSGLRTVLGWSSMTSQPLGLQAWDEKTTSSSSFLCGPRPKTPAATSESPPNS